MNSALRRLCFALAASVLLCARSTASAEETCVECHSGLRDPRLRAPIDELAASVHGHEQLTCSSCHGGRPDEPTVKAHDATKGFQARAAAGKPDAVCGPCHADKAAMADHDASVPTDQLDKYKASMHGLAFARGESRAATCTACHGSHAVRKVTDPEASVHPRNVAAMCAHCHSDAALMSALEMPHDQEPQWRRSVHGQSHTTWLQAREKVPTQAEERHPPTCNDCHSDHRIGPRDKATVACERCHAEEWDSFEAGPHAKAFARMGFLPCVDCHGSHEILPVNGGLIGVDHEAACLRCHADGQDMFEDIRRVSDQVRAAEDAAQRVRETRAGLPMATVAAQLAPVDEAQRALRVVVHTLDLPKISSAARELSSRASAVPEASMDEPEIFAEVKTGLPAVLLLIAGVVALLLSLQRGTGGKP